MEPLVVVRSIVVVIHLIGFAVVFGACVVEAAARRFQATRLMNWGLLIALVAGLVLAAPWPAGVDLNYTKLGIKLIVLIVIGALISIGLARQRRGGSTPRAVFWSIGALTLLNAAIAVMWGYSV